MRSGWAIPTDRAASAAHLMLCLDYDGTLVPIAPHPAAATLDEQTRRLLRQLARARGVQVVLISGRSVRDLKRTVGIRGLGYVGNHGLECSASGPRYVHPAAQRSRPRLQRLARNLRSALRPIRGAWVEDKGLTVSLHWRRVPPSAARRFHRVVAERLRPSVAQGEIRVTSGKHVIEIRPPVSWGKGDAIVRLLRHLPARRARPLVLYVGDDRTDEDAFRTVNRLGGLTIAVGKPPRRTAARYRLKDPRDVRAWLETLRRLRTR
ncbi:MAG: trehalose-phosphatase [Candidatus Omnitrophica bacterium]|nr:trehalose-phosphatase [Candidatus Omnitrophota bacterium]